MKKIYIILNLVISACVLTACSSDELTESIFDTTIPDVDTTSATGPFDKWLYDNFVVPYNTEIQYKFNYNSSNLNYQLTAADYRKSQLLAHFIKYLFYEVYDKYAPENFMRQYAPRIFHFIGSKALNTSSGTEELGYASAGVKITLIGVNYMKAPDPGFQYDSKDMSVLNQKYFHTMHHEFSHILHQNKSYPVAYGQVTPGIYDGRSWQKNDSVRAHSNGCVTHYAMKASYEDFVELLSCTITDTDARWMRRLVNACINGGVHHGDKERVYEFIKNLGITDAVLDAPGAVWNKFTIYKETALNEETGEYEATGRYIPSFHREDVEFKNKDQDTPLTLKFEKEADITSFRYFLDTWVQEDNEGDNIGINAFFKKFEIASEWYKNSWNMDLFDLRQEVRVRQDSINEFIKTVEIYDIQ